MHGLFPRKPAHGKWVQRKYRYCFINYCIKARHHLRSMLIVLGTQWEILFVPKNFWSKQVASFQLCRQNVYFTKLRTESESHKSKSTYCLQIRQVIAKEVQGWRSTGTPLTITWVPKAASMHLKFELRTVFLVFVGFVFVQSWAL